LPFLETANIYDWTKAHGINLFQRTEKSLFASEENIAFAKNILAPLQDKKKIFCVIGASSINKMWPTEHWIDFLKPLAEAGWGIVLNGYGPTEQAVADKIADALPQTNTLNLVGKLNFVHMIGVASACQIAAGHDTGPLHLVALCGVPTVGIFDYIQPIEAGYNVPWLVFAVARAERLQTFYHKKRNANVLAELKVEKVREKFDELVEKYKL
ncbi:MAG: hypothetical protein KBS54_07035, partial [Synergistaceae bacterium]|nr:hypothetical protein [Candidatus Equadaptatus faecalis]